MPTVNSISLSLLLCFSGTALGAAYDRLHVTRRDLDPNNVYQWKQCMSQYAKVLPEQCSALDPDGSIAAANGGPAAPAPTTTSAVVQSVQPASTATANTPAENTAPVRKEVESGSDWQTVKLTPHDGFAGNAIPCMIDTDYLAWFPPPAIGCDSMCYEIQPLDGGESFHVLNQDSPSAGAHDISYWAFVAHLSNGAPPASGGAEVQLRVAPKQSECDKLLKGGNLTLSTSASWTPRDCPAGTWAGDRKEIVNIPIPMLVPSPVYGTLDECVYDGSPWTCSGSKYIGTSGNGPDVPKLEGCSYINWNSADAHATSMIGTATPGGAVFTTVAHKKY